MLNIDSVQEEEEAARIQADIENDEFRNENDTTLEEDEKDGESSTMVDYDEMEDDEEELRHNSSFASSSGRSLGDKGGGKHQQSGNNSGTTKRGILPKKATSIMRNWLFRHVGVWLIKYFFCLLIQDFEFFVY
jgi:hypothetical protein